MSKKPFPSQTQDRFIVRFPDGMREWIAEEAKKNGRSMNSEIISRLETTRVGDRIHDEDRNHPDSASEMIDAMASKIAERAIQIMATRLEAEKNKKD